MRNLMPYSLSSSPDVFPDMFHAFLRPIHQRVENEGAGMGIDIIEFDDEFVLKAEVPGISKEAISVKVEDDTVTIRANKEQGKEARDDGRVIRQERFWGQIERTVSLPGSIDETKARATYQDGLLTLVLPKKADREHRNILIE
ncbi:Hsp20/alpha crystallin family protein [Castellaniella sp. WN]